MLVVLIPFAPTEAHSFCARCGFFFFFFCCGLPVVLVVVLVFSDLLWASGLVFVLVAVGLCSLWVFFFFLLWTAGSGGGVSGGCACG